VRDQVLDHLAQLSKTLPADKAGHAGRALCDSPSHRLALAQWKDVAQETARSLLMCGGFPGLQKLVDESRDAVTRTALRCNHRPHRRRAQMRPYLLAETVAETIVAIHNDVLYKTATVLDAYWCARNRTAVLDAPAAG
jgi:hypothetical protein